MTYIESSKAYYMNFVKPPPLMWPHLSNILGACISIICATCLLCNSYVGFKLWKGKNIVRDSNYRKNRLYFLFMMCVFMNQLLSCSTEVILKHLKCTENNFS